MATPAVSGERRAARSLSRHVTRFRRWINTDRVFGTHTCSRGCVPARTAHSPKAPTSSRARAYITALGWVRDGPNATLLSFVSHFFLLPCEDISRCKSVCENAFPLRFSSSSYREQPHKSAHQSKYSEGDCDIENLALVASGTRLNRVYLHCLTLQAQGSHDH